MPKNPLFDFYKELYFHEIDVRESLNSRVQIPIAIIVSLGGAIAFMLLNLNKAPIYSLTILSVLFIVASLLSLLFGTYYLVRSWHGHTYTFLPTAKITENYRLNLINLYEDYKNCDSLVEQYLFEMICNKYIECSSENTICNDTRSIYLHRANRGLVFAIAFTALALVPFFFSTFEETSMVKCKNNVSAQLESTMRPEMSNTPLKKEPAAKPPAPPAPPPSRLIKEGVEIVPQKGVNE